MANVLGNAKREQVLALGRLGWSLRRIEETTGARRETASRYLTAAGIAVRAPGRWGHAPPKPAIEVSTDPASIESADAPSAKPAIETSTDLAWPPAPGRSPQASACEPYREGIELAVRQGRTAMAVWQDLVDDHGFASGYQSVRRFVVKLRADAPREAHPVIETAPGEEGQVDYGPGEVGGSARARRAASPAVDLDGDAHGPLEHAARAVARARLRDPGRRAPGRTAR